MTLILDVNLLLIAVFDSYNEHPVALAWFESIMNDSSMLVGLPVHSLLAFIRLSTASRRISGASFRPLTMANALEQVEIWTAQSNVFVPQPAQDHVRRVASLLRQANGNSDLVADAHLAALALEHGATMCSHDSDFTRFAGLTVLDPLRQPPLPPPL